ncbi:MAG: hypothetical protein WB810_16425 [Candidatus Cybelea sp.]
MSSPKRQAKNAALTGLALALPLLGVSPAPSSAEEFYAHAAEQMRRHAEPAFATYDASISGLNCSVEGVGIACTLGRNTAKSEAPFSVDLRESDGRIALRKESASVILGDSTFLNATWPGIDAIIRHGFIGTRSAPAPAPLPVQPPSALPVIAVVSALSVASYNVYDAGPATCSNGNAGHGVRLVARHDPLRYPLTAATVDLSTGDLCAVRFNAKLSAAAGLIGAPGGAQIDFENVAGYEVVTNERFDIDLRAIGIAVKHESVDVAYSDFAFPKTIDPEIFTTPSPPPARS